MKLILMQSTVLACVLVTAYGCVSLTSSDNRGDHAKLPEEVYAAAADFKILVGHDREAEGERLASAIHGILVFNGRRTEMSPGVWEEEILQANITSPLEKSDLIRLIGEPDDRDSDSLSYIVRNYDAKTGRQAKYIIIYFNHGHVVGTGRGISLIKRH